MNAGSCGCRETHSLMFAHTLVVFRLYDLSPFKMVIELQYLLLAYISDTNILHLTPAHDSYIFHFIIFWVHCSEEFEEILGAS